VPETRSFEDREAPLQAMEHEDLLVRFDVEEQRMRTLVSDVQVNPESVIPWTGRRMDVAKFIPHLRIEHALRRWDVVGDGELGDHPAQSGRLDSAFGSRAWTDTARSWSSP
jgi:hypothetical protein